ncbi:hypothetical protein DAEQUDRAFT_726705 [Daedalea quercina L-15889]|uniref:Uncharacterized protein n=1 Tax=Daedalea quercina L-15889 TaxID=1314783 RepID=A0A165QFQ2_9APHY|nr:hypothetical protein DAEQUDRAFT_726705 [Daedalea quercina L-15889]
MRPPSHLMAGISKTINLGRYMTELFLILAWSIERRMADGRRRLHPDAVLLPSTRGRQSGLKRTSHSDWCQYVCIRPA